MVPSCVGVREQYETLPFSSGEKGVPSQEQAEERGLEEKAERERDLPAACVM